MNRVYVVFFIVFSVLFSKYESFKVLAIPSFTNLTGNEQYNWYNEALSDMLTTDISATNKVRVVSRNELKKILDEQKLSSSGLMSDQAQISIGNMLGANLIVSGSYTIIGDKIRIDIKSFDVEKGTVEAASSVEGRVENIFKLEKKLALKTIDALGIELSDEDKINLFQIQSNKLLAVENNYKGIIALDKNKTQEAENYFKQATEIDPYYKDAKVNYDNTTSLSFSGSSLFSNISTELESKEKQLTALKKIYKTFTDSYWVVEIKGEPKPITTAGNSKYVDIEVPVEVSFSHDAIRSYVNTLQDISKGNKKISMEAKDVFYDAQTFSLYKESWDWLKSTRTYFNKTMDIVFIDNESNILATGSFILSRHKDYGPDYSFPHASIQSKSDKVIFVDSYNNWQKSIALSKKHKNQYSTSIRLKDIPISHISKMAGVEIR